MNGPRPRAVLEKIGALLVLGLMIVGRAVPSDLSYPLSSYSHKQWTSQNGLPQNSIQVIVQTRDGYLWLGTENGLARFNGSHFQCFSSENTPQFRSNDVLAMKEDRSGALWIGTTTGLIRYREGRFEEVPDIHGNRDIEITQICEDRRGNVWFGTDRGLARYKDGAFQVLEGLNGLIMALMVDDFGNLWTGTGDGYLARLAADSLDGPSLGRLKYSPIKLAPIIYKICEDNSGNVLAVSGEDLFIAPKGEIEKVSRAGRFPGKRISALMRDANGDLWVAGSGVMRMRAAPPYGPSADVLFPDDSIISLYCDNSGDVWLGSRGSGLHRLSRTLFKTFTRKDGLSNEFIRSVYEDPNGRLLVGTNRGLNYYDQGRFSQDGLEFFASRKVMSVAMEGPNRLLAAVSNDGLFQWSNGRGRPLDLGQEDGAGDFTCLLIDRSGTVWAGTSGQGLFCGRKGLVTNYSSRNGLKGDTIHCLLEGRDGRLWVGTTGGLNCIKDGKVIELPEGCDIQAVVCSVYQDEDGDLWAGTIGKGLLSLKDGALASFSSDDGLSSNSVYCILEDDQKRLWMSCEKGIFFVPKQELKDYRDRKIARFHCKIFDESDGLNVRESSVWGEPSAARTRDGRLWFSTVKGLAMLEPGAKLSHPCFRSASVKSILANGKRSESSRGGTFPSGTKTVEFPLDIINFKDYENTRIRYRLAGHDKGWRELKGGMELTARYEDLPGGRYQFYLMVLSPDDEWKACGSPVPIRILPYFYQTPWFYALTSVLLLASVLIAREVVVVGRAKRRLKRYGSAKLTSEKSEAFLKVIVDLMEKENLFTDKDLNLSKLSEMTSIPSAFISQVINIKLKLNFYDFLNMYRIRYAEKIILSPEKAHFKVEAIGLEAGFRSKSSFFQAFKKFTGMTPSEFKKDHSRS